VFVVDLFGAGIRPGAPQLPQAVVAPFLNDRSRFRRRLFASLQTLQGRPECDASRVAAIGYCLGGCGVLELARAGAGSTKTATAISAAGAPTLKLFQTELGGKTHMIIFDDADLEAARRR